MNEKGDLLLMMFTIIKNMGVPAATTWATARSIEHWLTCQRQPSWRLRS